MAVRAVVDLPDCGMSLWIRWLSTTVAAGMVALPLGNVDTVFIGNVVVFVTSASTATADASVTPCRSSNACTCVALSSAFSFTDAGGELRYATEPVDELMCAYATPTVVATITAALQMAMISFLCLNMVAPVPSTPEGGLPISPAPGRLRHSTPNPTVDIPPGGGVARELSRAIG